ncbi:hypothetical protein [Emergencia timonensis]|nr:hypothetical protein [Emergencia timonensis]
MFVFGLVSGITRKIDGNEYYYRPLLVSAFGLIMTLMPLYAHAFA